MVLVLSSRPSSPSRLIPIPPECRSLAGRSVESSGTIAPVIVLRLLLAAALAAVFVPAGSARHVQARLQGPPTAAQLLQQINAQRTKRGLRLLRLSKPLNAAAYAHTLDMGEKGYFSHDSKGGPTFSKRIRQYYPGPGYRTWAAGENILWSSGTIDAASAVRLWMHSPGHRANILRRQWTEIGISAQTFTNAPGVYRGLTVTIATTDFGTRQP